MPLEVVSRRTEDLVRELAALAGESVDDAVARAAEERLARLRAAMDARVLARLQAVEAVKASVRAKIGAGTVSIAKADRDALWDASGT